MAFRKTKELRGHGWRAQSFNLSTDLKLIGRTLILCYRAYLGEP